MPFQAEQPQHGVALPAFEISRYPATNVQYASFVRATGHAASEHWGDDSPPSDLADHPVVYVSIDFDIKESDA